MSKNMEKKNSGSQRRAESRRRSMSDRESAAFTRPLNIARRANHPSILFIMPPISVASAARNSQADLLFRRPSSSSSPLRAQRFPSQLKIFAFDRKQICISSFVCVTLISARARFDFRVSRETARDKNREIAFAVHRALSLSLSLSFFFTFLFSPSLPFASYRVCACVRACVRARERSLIFASRARNAKSRSICETPGRAASIAVPRRALAR